MIDRATIDRIMDATNIVDVVSEYVSLRKRGVNYVGLCPFHNDSHPSFSVSPSRGICHCFTCGKGGNAVNFLMELEQMTYPDALRWLARKYNIEVRERELSDEEKKRENERESMFIVNEWAAKYFQQILHEDVDGMAIGMQYFRSRGFRDDIIRKFQLGFALNQRDALSQAAVKHGYQAEFLIKTGLCYQRDGGGLVDRFAGRAIFPWIGVSGKVVAFGGRVLDSRTKGVSQKYVNSPDSEVYHKERELYGIYQAKKAIAKEDCVYMVEGYTDVISMHQCGIENVVANSGTALSNYQIRMLHRFTNNIVLLYDGDAAGIHAAMRGTDMLLSEGMNIKVLLLPDGNDPDSFARNHTAADFKSYIEEHQTDFIQFKTNLLLKGVTDPIKRSEAINSIVESISLITDQIVRAAYIHDCAQRLGINEATLISQMNRFIRNGKDERQKAEMRSAGLQQAPGEPSVPGAVESRPAIEAAKTTQEKEVERMIIQMVFRHGDELISVDANGGEGETETVTLPVAQYIYYDLEADGLKFRNDTYNRVLTECVDHLDDETFKAENYFLRHHDPKISKLAVEMSVDKVPMPKNVQTQPSEDKLRNEVVRLVLDFRMNYVEGRLEQLKRDILRHADDNDKMMALMEEYKNMQIIRNNLARHLGSNIVL